MKLPTMTKISTGAARTLWKATFPSTLRSEGATYYVETYPNSALIFIRSAVRNRRVRGARIEKAIREALASIV